MADRLEPLRAHVTATVEHATNLLAALTSLDEAFHTLLPRLGDMTNAESEAYLARLCGYDEALTDKLRELVESLADVLAGLRTTDGGKLWLKEQLARLESGEDVKGAA